MSQKELKEFEEKMQKMTWFDGLSQMWPSWWRWKESFAKIFQVAQDDPLGSWLGLKLGTLLLIDCN